MSKINLTELRQIIRDVIIERLQLEFVTKDMPNGSAWKVANKGWAAKNTNGVTNYWYGKDEVKNKEAASAWSKDSSKEPHKHAGESPSKERGIQHPNKPSKPTVGV
jgi:hypothetical protein